MENYKHMLAMIQKLQSLKVEKMGQILCVKKVPFCKSGHIYGNYTFKLKEVQSKQAETIHTISSAKFEAIHTMKLHVQ